MVRVKRSRSRNKTKLFDSSWEEGGAVVFWQCTWHSFLNGHGHWRSGEGVWHMHLVYVQPGSWKWAWSQGKRVGRQRKWRETTTEQSELGDWLPAQDDFQLAAVELPSVGQAHDALLVARQALHIYLLEDRPDSQCESSENKIRTGMQRYYFANCSPTQPLSTPAKWLTARYINTTGCWSSGEMCHLGRSNVALLVTINMNLRLLGFSYSLLSPSCSSGKGLVAERPAPAHQCNRFHPERCWQKRTANYICITEDFKKKRSDVLYGTGGCKNPHRFLGSVILEIIQAANYTQCFVRSSQWLRWTFIPSLFVSNIWFGSHWDESSQIVINKRWFKKKIFTGSQLL